MAGTYLKLNRDDFISVSTSPGFADFDSYLESISQRTDSMQPAFEIAGQVIATSVRKNFIEQGRPEKWQQLAPATKFNIIGGSKGFKKSGDMRIGAIRKLASRKILIGRGMSGGLMGSINFRAASDNVRVGTPKVYGAIHQYGGKAGRGHAVTIPARPYLAIQDEDWPAIKDAFIRYLTKV
jgi:phage virion morphogenesis protein